MKRKEKTLGGASRPDGFAFTTAGNRSEMDAEREETCSSRLAFLLEPGWLMGELQISSLHAG